MENSKIEWCDHTGNIWNGCTHVHSGCDHCYAETLAHRWKKDVWGNDKPRMVVKSFFSDIAKYKKKAADSGETHSVFVGSMMDVAEKSMPLIDSKGNLLSYETDILRGKFFNEIVPASPNLIFLLLSKRPGNYNKQIPRSWLENPPANVMFGTSISDQASADLLIPHLLQVKGQRFLSIEPMLERICFDPEELNGIHWIIVGGESGHKKRPFNPDWARLVRDQVKDRIPFFMKQIDKIQSIPEDLMIREFPKLLQ